MRKNTFVFIISSYNNAKWFKRNLESITYQNYPYWRTIYIDDCSTDDTFQLVQKFIHNSGVQHKFTLLHNKIKLGKAFSKYRAIHLCKDEEICIFLDGNDWLYSNDVLTFLNEIYNEEKLLATYGGYIEYEFGEEIESNLNKDYSVWSKVNRFYRKEPWIAKNLQTFYSFLGKNISIFDIIQEENKFIQKGDDMVFIYSILEQSMGKCRLVNEKTLYVLNKESNHEESNNLQYNKKCINRIQNIKPYKPVTNQYKTLGVVKFDDEDWYNKLIKIGESCDQLLLSYDIDFEINSNITKYKEIITVINDEICNITGNNKLNYYFPHILLINLKRREDRLFRMKKLLKDYEIEYEVIDGIDGNDYLIKEEFRRIIGISKLKNSKEYGSLLSYIKALRYAKSKGYPSVLILEDDLYFHKKFKIMLNKLNKIPKKWDLIYLGACQNQESISFNTINNDWYIANQTYGTFATGISCSIYDSILKRLEKRMNRVDSELIKIQEGRNSYVVYQNIIICETDDSDVETGVELINSAKKYHWVLENYLLRDCHEEVSMLLIAKELDIITNLCIRSFLDKSYKVNLYTYVPIQGLPTGAVRKDAESILSLYSIQNMDIEKIKSLFAYTLLYKKGGLFVNHDIFCLKNINWKEHLLVRDHTGGVSSKIIASLKGDLLMKSLIELEKGGLKDKMRLIESFNLINSVKSYNEYYSVYPTNIEKLLLNKEYDHDHIENDSVSVCLWFDRWKQYEIVENSYIHRMINLHFKISAFIVVTEPLATGYPIIECVKSVLPLLDELVIIYGRDEIESREKLCSLSKKIRCIVTNKWEKRWHYSAMTDHMHLGLMSCSGDLIFKLDSDYIFKFEKSEDIERYRMKLFSHLLTDHIIYLPKCNYLINGYFCYIEKNIYCINKYLLNRDKLSYKIDVNNYVNSIIINGKHNVANIKDKEYAIFNYDCTIMNWDQFISKQRAWFTAYYMYAGNLNHFKIDMNVVNNDHKLYKYVIDRLIKRIEWSAKKGALFKYGDKFNPKVIRPVIKSLDNTQYGNSYFNCKEITQILSD